MIIKRSGMDLTKEFTRQDLIIDTVEHRKHVDLGMWFLANLLKSQGENHDCTKTGDLDGFHEYLKKKKRTLTDSSYIDDLHNDEWWKKHIVEERYHLNSNCPQDVNLLDILEMLVDGCVTGTARNGKDSVFQISLPEEVLLKALKNTQKLIMDNIEEMR